MNEAQYFEYINLYLAGRITEDEHRKLREWLEASEENRHKFAEMEAFWRQSQPPQPRSVPASGQAWEKIASRPEFDEQQKGANVHPLPVRKRRGIHPYRIGLYAAAAVVLLFVLLQTVLKPGRYEVFATMRGQRAEVKLPDNSTVKLNAESEIKYARHFADSARDVSLRGQGFFEVTHDGRPFVVRTENATITVLGTRFDVFARNDKTAVIVKEGRVEVRHANTDSSSSVIVGANQKAVLVGGQALESPTTVEADFLIGWLDNRFVFYKTPLTDIVAEIQRRYDIEISIQPQGLGERTISGSFLEQTVDSTLSSLCFTLDLTYKFDGSSYIISEF